MDRFHSPELPELVRECFASNPSWAAARARLESARLLVHQQDASLRPRLDLLGSGSRGEDNSQPLAQARTAYGLGLDASWELDVWGRLGDQRDAVGKEAEAVASDTQALRLSLAAQVAQAWISAVELRAQATLAEATAESFEKTGKIVQDRYQQGLVQSLDVRLTLASAASARAAVHQAHLSHEESVRALWVLLGGYPGGRSVKTAALPALPPPPPAGIPSELLERRPDLLAARARLEAAGRSLDASQKEFYPKISLTGQGGVRSDELGDVVQGEETYWSAGAGIRQSVYAGGALTAARDIREAQLAQASANAQAIALQAFREVESALSAEQWGGQRLEALKEAERESREAERLAQEQYRDGLTDIITVLEAQRRWFETQSRVLGQEGELLRNRVRLHLALGGDFLPESEAGAHP